MKKKLLLIAMIIFTLIVGNAIGNATSSTAALSWLGKSIAFGIDPTSIDLSIFKLVLGFSLDVNIAQILLSILMIVLYPKIAKAFNIE